MNKFLRQNDHRKSNIYQLVCLHQKSQYLVALTRFCVKYYVLFILMSPPRISSFHNPQLKVSSQSMHLVTQLFAMWWSSPHPGLSRTPHYLIMTLRSFFEHSSTFNIPLHRHSSGGGLPHPSGSVLLCSVSDRLLGSKLTVGSKLALF